MRALATNPSSSPVWRAIISSSLVGITHAETLLVAVEIRGPSCVVRVAVEIDAEPRRGVADAAADFGRVLADAGR